MTGYNANDTFTAPEIYDLSDLVQGGATGDANVPIMALADQANYLRNRLHRWESVKNLWGSYNIDPVGDLGQYLVINIGSNATLVLPDAGAVPVGTRFPIATAIAGIKSLTVLAQGGQRILDGSLSWLTWDTSQPGIYMHDAEKLVLVACNDHYYVESAIGNFYTYGDSFGARMQRGNTVIANGSLYNRADVPRLALLATSGASCVTGDGTWLSDPGGLPSWRGLFSSGNGSTTLRVPDERAMSDRYLDLGRGIDFYRNPNYPGGYEGDAVGPHTHPIHYEYNGTDGTANGKILYTGVENNPSGMDTDACQSNGTLETIVKNIGKIPLIKY